MALLHSPLPCWLNMNAFLIGKYIPESQTTYELNYLYQPNCICSDQLDMHKYFATLLSLLSCTGRNGACYSGLGINYGYIIVTHNTHIRIRISKQECFGVSSLTKWEV